MQNLPSSAPASLPDEPLLQWLYQSLRELLQGKGSADSAATSLPQVSVAYSTGPDSTALLHGASRLRDLGLLHLRALHVNHQLHPDCQRWQLLAAQQCRQLQVPLTVIRVQVDQSTSSMETAARDARYRAFVEHLHRNEILLLAHHARDQAETVLLHLLRGSGAGGLSGMPQSRPLGDQGACLLRPWLHCPVTQVRDYCSQHALVYSEDSSNSDPQHDRGWLRNEVLPLLERRKPGAVANIACSARLLAHNRRLAIAQLDRHLQAMLTQGQTGASHGSIDIDALLQCNDRLLQHDLLRHWLQSQRLQPPSRRQLDTLITQLDTADQDKHPLLHQHHYTMECHQRRLYVHDRNTARPTAARWQLPQTWQHARFGQLSLAPARQSAATENHAVTMSAAASRWPLLEVTARHGGERIKLPDGHHHQVKKLLQQAGIPSWQRYRLPLLWHRQQLLAVANLYLHPALQRWLQQRKLQLHWQPAADY